MNFDETLLRGGSIGGYPIKIIPSDVPGCFQHSLYYDITADCYYENEETSANFVQHLTSLCSSNLRRNDGTKSHFLASPSTCEGFIKWTFNYSNTFVIHKATIRLQSESDDAGGVITTICSLDRDKEEIIYGSSLAGRGHRIVDPIDITKDVSGLHGFVLTVKVHHGFNSRLFPSTLAAAHYSFEVSVMLKFSLPQPPSAYPGHCKFNDNSADIKITRPGYTTTTQDSFSPKVVCKVHSEVLRERWPQYCDDKGGYIEIMNASEAIILAAMDFMYTSKVCGIEDEDEFWKLLAFADSCHFDTLKEYCQGVLWRFVTKENWGEVAERAKRYNAKLLMFYASSFQLYGANQGSQDFLARKLNRNRSFLRKATY